jgi:UDP-N-acetylmuramoyl-L-alanine---L-glutamate ligase
VSESLRVRDLAGQRVVVWGFGTEGRAAARLLRRHVTPASLHVVVDGDVPAELPEDLADLAVLNGADADRAIAQAQVIVKSPGVSPYHGRLAEQGAHAVITGGTALWFAETGGARAIGVTGSKGKSTTTSLIAHLLSALSIPNVLAGNVGRALLDVLDEQLSAAASNAAGPTSSPGPTVRLTDRQAGSGAPALTPDSSGNANSRSVSELTYALELSSFQSAEVRNSPEVGVLTALFPEHLDWHGSVERYYADKANLFAHPTRNAASARSTMQPGNLGARTVVAANNDNPTVRAMPWPSVAPVAVVVPYGIDGGITVAGHTLLDADGSLLIDLTGAQLPGRHNAINLAGALTALRAYGIDLRAHQAALQTAAIGFVPLAHRLQPVGSVGGRLVVDDSLSTAPQAAVAALAAFADRPVGIIVGGHDRGLDYEPLAAALAQRTTPTWVCGVPLSGERIVPLIQRALSDAGNTAVVVKAFDDFDDAVHHAAGVVPEGGVILLSPAAPSFGRFVDYRDRGMHFRALLGIKQS